MSYISFSDNIAMPVCLITVKSDSIINSMTVAWSTPLSSNPPLWGFAIRKQRFTYEILMKSKEFTVTFLPYEQAELAVKLGRISGREGDKLKICGVKLKDAEFISTPYIEEGYYSMECSLEDSFTTGDHEFIVGEILYVHKNNESLANYQPSIYLGKDAFSTVDKTRIKKFEARTILEEMRKKFSRGGQSDK